MKSSSNSLTRILFIALIIGIPILAICLFLWFGVLNASCTVGVTGYAANVEFTGLGANGACSSFLNSDSVHLYQYQGEPTGTEICVGSYQTQNSLISVIGSLSVHFVVRDTGLFDLVGNALCKSLLSSGTRV